LTERLKKVKRSDDMWSVLMLLLSSRKVVTAEEDNDGRMCVRSTTGTYSSTEDAIDS